MAHRWTLVTLPLLLLAWHATAAGFERVHSVESDALASRSLGPPAWDGSGVAWTEYVLVNVNQNPLPSRMLCRRPAQGMREVVATTSDSRLGLQVSGFSLDGGALVWRLRETPSLSMPESIDPDIGLYAVGSPTSAISTATEPELLVGHDSPFPPPDYPYLAPGPPRARGGRVAFAGLRYDGAGGGATGVWVWEAGTITELPVPGGANPGLFDFSPVSLGGDSAALVAWEFGDAGVVVRLHHVSLGPGSPGEMGTWAQQGDPLPGGGSLASIGNPTLDRTRGDAACFRGVRDDGATGIYVASEAGIERVADETSAIPNGVGTFASFELDCSLDEGRVVFVGRGQDEQVGIYQGTPGGPLLRIVDRSSTLDGSPVRDLQLGPEALAAGRVAFTAELDANPGGESIASRYAVFVPEPGGVARIFAAVAALAALRRARS